MDSNHGPRPYQGRALTKLSYTPAKSWLMLSQPRILTAVRKNPEKHWACMDSNHGPRPYQGRALTKLSYTPAMFLSRKYLLHDFNRINFFEKLSMGRGESFEKGMKITELLDVKP